MKNLFRLLCLLLLPAAATFGQTGIKTAPDLKTDLQQHIRYLASDELHGRMTGSPDEKLAADYIINEFVKLGLPNSKGNYNKKKYLQAFSYTSKMDSTRKKVTGNNVLAFMNNKAATTIVIGAHYDHLGMGLPAHSMYRGEPAVHNGADDNASGVAMVIELAKKLASEPTHKHNYLFILFSGEELGLYGSKWFVEHPSIRTDKIDYMLNFDMVGRMDSITHTLILGGVGTSTDWAAAFDTLATGVHLKTTESGVGPSDHTSFYLKNIPVLHFFTGQHKDYHKPGDDEAKINYDGMQRVFNFTTHLLNKLDEKDRLVFIKTKDDNNDDAPKFTVTLGVMPDYTFEGEGMRIDGVTDGKPASKAGLQTGDVVVKLGQLDVKDMMGYMKALAQFKKGDATQVKVKRGKEVLVKDIQF